MILDIRIADNEDLPLLIQLYEEIEGYSTLSTDKGKEIFAAISSIHNYHINRKLRRRDTWLMLRSKVANKQLKTQKRY